MELSKAREIKETPATAQNTQWLLWVDDEIWGHVSTLEDAQWFLAKISSDVSNELKKAHPQWTIDCETAEDKVVKVKCLHPGYVYNSRWTAHTVRYEPVYKLIRDNTESTRKRAPSFDAIQNQDKTAQPATRPPTPRPEEKEGTVVSETAPPPPPPPPALDEPMVSSSASRRKLKKNRKAVKEE
jgi:hypothetical protein